jgi:hypothetical protein
LLPVADTARAEVANFPGSGDISYPTYLQPRRAISLSDISTIVIPVSFMFHMSPGPALRLSTSSFRFIKEKH